MFVLFLFQKKNKCVRERRGVRTAVKGIPVNSNQSGGHKTRSIKELIVLRATSRWDFR